jgi:NAD(P)-dependent dehydrogenase (short-subunit alcohol dehydrogenase family)
MPAKLAIVTGAYGGLGSELCRKIAADGVNLILIDRDLRKSQVFAALLNRIYPGAVIEAFAVDLADHGDIKRLTAEVVARHPKIDFLFNNAGVLTETLQFSGHANELHFEVNTLAPLQLIDQLRPALKAANGATIVSTSAGLSMGAKTLDWSEILKPASFKKLYGSYVNSKQALNVITAALADELGTDAIRIRAADPGPNKTRLTKGKGTPLWMRLFYAFLPTPDKGAQKIFDASAASGWGGASGIFVSNGKTQTLPPALATKAFQAELLGKCRERAAMGT